MLRPEPSARERGILPHELILKRGRRFLRCPPESRDRLDGHTKTLTEPDMIAACAKIAQPHISSDTLLNMARSMLRWWFIAFLNGMMAASPIIMRVTVLDAEFRPIRTITSAPELAIFSELWAARVNYSADMRPGYKIDIQSDGRSVRWLYDPAGFVQALSIKNTPVYRLSSPAAFNELLGISQGSNPIPRGPTP